LLHPSVVRVVGDASDVHTPGFQVDHEQHEIANESAAVSTSTVKKSVAAMAPQWDLRNADQDVRLLRSGAGSIPCAARTRAIVFLPTSCPMLRSAPRMRVS
jgi:hypothetical protein